jgi:hypothetical protein
MEKPGKPVWTSAHERAIKSWLASRSPQLKDKEIVKIVARSLIDPVFRKALLADYKKVFKEYGVALPKKLRLTVTEDTDTRVYLVLPAVPRADTGAGTRELTYQDFSTLRTKRESKEIDDWNFGDIFKDVPDIADRFSGRKVDVRNMDRPDLKGRD